MRAVVLRGGTLEVRETADPVPGPGELLIKPLSAAICASDVHYMDHPNSADRFVWDPDRDTVMGHEFIGEVVGHGPDCSGDFPVGARVTSLSEHHAVVAWDGSPRPPLGSRLRVVPNHVCTAVNLADELLTTDGDVWPVAARGANT